MSDKQGSETDCSYDRNDLVGEVTAFYEFLTTMYIPPEALRRPPPDGWPNINAETYRSLNKTDRVIDLIRHLPYITRHTAWPYEIYLVTAVVDYEGDPVKREVRRATESGKPLDVSYVNIEPESSYTHIPPHVLCLASETCGADGHFFLIDTTIGTITVYSLGGHRFLRDHPGTIDLEGWEGEYCNTEEWRSWDTFRPKELFDILKDKFRKLELFPNAIKEVKGSYHTELEAAFEEIFADYGWPEQPILDKDGCSKRLGEAKDRWVKEVKRQEASEKSRALQQSESANPEDVELQKD